MWFLHGSTSDLAFTNGCEKLPSTQYTLQSYPEKTVNHQCKAPNDTVNTNITLSFFLENSIK